MHRNRPRHAARARRLAVVPLLLLAAAGAPGDPRVPAAPELEREPARHRLPRELREVSGLAATPDGRLFAHGDEAATVYQLQPAGGRVLKRFSLGAPPFAADLEGIAVAGSRLYLVTSDGVLYEFAEGPDGGTVPFRAVDTGLGARCEVEGLAYRAAGEQLLLACKTARRPEVEGRVAVYAYSLRERRLGAAPVVSVAWSALPGGKGKEEFHASGVEVHPSGEIYLVSARDNLLLRVVPPGRVAGAHRLRRGRHPQAEGIAFLPDGTLVVADEGGSGAATLSLYPPGAPR